MRVAGDRYVEVFLKMQAPARATCSKHDSPTTSTRSGSEADDRSSFGESSAAADVTEEHAVEELEAFLGHHSQGVLLSMLGIAAGDATRAWMREKGLGLKQLLARHAGTFVVEGEKGKQAVRLGSRTPWPQLPEMPPLPIVPQQWALPPEAFWPLFAFPLMPFPLLAAADLVPAIRLRALPFAATEADVWAFLAQDDVNAQVWCGAAGVAAIQVVRRKNGRATGQATVHFAAGIPRAEVEKLHMRCMGDRYIEVLDEGPA